MKKLIALLLVMVMALSFASCKKTEGEETPTGDNSANYLKMGLSGYDGTFNPIMTDNVYDTYVCDTIFEALIALSPDGEYIPGYITDGMWEISEDHLTYTFKLKDGVKFSDGTPMTAADVEFTFKTIANKDYNGPRAYAVASFAGYADYNAGTTDVFEGIKVIDEKTISFTFAEGNASPANIECFAYGILSKDYYAFTSWDEFLALNDKPMGSGVMVLDSWAPKQFIKLNNNKNYWDPSTAAKIDGVLLQEVSDDTLISAIQTGQVDFGQPAASVDNANAIKALDNATLTSYLGNGYTFMCFNTTLPKLADVKVRQALLYALDRESFIIAQYGSTDIAQVGLAPMSPTSWAFPDQSELNAYSYDLDKAAALLDEAGWKLNAAGKREKDGEVLELSWLVYTDSPWPGVLSAMAYDSWGKIGVTLNIEQMDFDTVASRTMDPAPADKDFEIYTMGFSLSVDPDPTGALFDADAYSAGGFNASGFRDEESQKLIAAGKAEFDQEKRAEIYKEWVKLQNELVPTVIIAYRSEIWGINNRVKGMNLGTYSDWVSCLRNITLEA